MSCDNLVPSLLAEKCFNLLIKLHTLFNNPHILQRYVFIFNDTLLKMVLNLIKILGLYIDFYLSKILPILLIYFFKLTINTIAYQRYKIQYNDGKEGQWSRIQIDFFYFVGSVSIETLNWKCTVADIKIVKILYSYKSFFFLPSPLTGKLRSPSFLSSKIIIKKEGWIHFFFSVKPKEVKMTVLSENLSAGRPQQHQCDTWGSIPPAKITWLLEGETIRTAAISVFSYWF